MIKVKVSVHHPNWPFTKQTPGKVDHIWKDKYHFFINQDIPECDYWIVMNDLKVRNSTNYSETCLCPPENTIFLPEEPPSIRRYTDSFMRQFHTVFTCHEGVKHPNVVKSHSFLPWFIGYSYSGKSEVDFDFLNRNNQLDKLKEISLVTSSKTMTAGHRNRIDFAKRLKEEFKDKLDLFGLDKPFDSKWETIAPYKYHIAIENSTSHNYWSEKIADSYLGMAFPIYSGCPNLSDYFDSQSFSTIDLSDFKGSKNKIEEILADDSYLKKKPLLEEMKQRVLFEYNFFSLIENGFESSRDLKKEKITIFNERHFDSYSDVAKRRFRRWWMRNF